MRSAQRFFNLVNNVAEALIGNPVFFGVYFLPHGRRGKVILAKERSELLGTRLVVNVRTGRRMARF